MPRLSKHISDHQKLNLEKRIRVLAKEEAEKLPRGGSGGGGGGGGSSLPPSGTTGQILTKRSDAEGDVEWAGLPPELGALEVGDTETVDLTLTGNVLTADVIGGISSDFNLDGGAPDSNYGGILAIDGGGV